MSEKAPAPYSGDRDGIEKGPKRGLKEHYDPRASTDIKSEEQMVCKPLTLEDRRAAVIEWMNKVGLHIV